MTTPTAPHTDDLKTPGSVAAYLAMALLAGSGLMTVLGIETIGILIAPVTVLGLLLVISMSMRGRVDQSSLAGLIAGLAVLPVWFGYLAMGHPGLSDDVVADSGLPSAWIFIGTGVALVGCSVGLFEYTRRRTASQSQQTLSAPTESTVRLSSE